MEERDVLTHLLGIEKSAAEMVLAAQEEADRRIAEASQYHRDAYQSRFDAASQELEAQSIKTIQDARSRAEKDLEEYHRNLAERSMDSASFNMLCNSLLFGAI